MPEKNDGADEPLQIKDAAEEKVDFTQNSKTSINYLPPFIDRELVGSLALYEGFV